MAELFPIPQPDSFINLLQLMNEYVPNFWNIFSFVFWLILFLSSTTLSMAQKLASSFFITTMSVILLFVLGLVHESVVLAMIIGTAMSTLWLYFRKGT